MLSDPVRAYFDDLSAGRSGDALGLAESPPADTSFLGTDALKHSIDQAPISGLKLDGPKVDGDHADILASYMIGQQPFQRHISLTRADDKWRLDNVTATVHFSETATITVDGTDLSGRDSVDLFPGLHALGSTNRLLSVKNQDLLVDAPQEIINATPTLVVNDQAQADLRQAAQAKLASCLREKSFAPVGCGFSVRSSGDGYAPNESTTKWLASPPSNQAFNDATFVVDNADQVSARISLNLKWTGKTFASENVTGCFHVSRVIADISDPDAVTVSFTNEA